MAEHITYEGILERPLTEEQALTSKEYTRVFRTNDIVIKKEEYRDSKLYNIVYYLSPGEEEAEAISQVMSAYPGIDFEIRERVWHGSYRLEKSSAFTAEGASENYFHTALYDDGNRLIYERTESIFKGIAETDIRKYFYSERDSIQYECFYDNTGKLAGITGPAMSPFVAENNYTIIAGELPFHFPGFSTTHEYYTTDELLPVTIR